MKHYVPLALMLLWTSVVMLRAEDPKQASVEQLVAGTHAASLKLREEALRKTIAKDTAWPRGTWGDNLWCLAALYLDEKADAANERLLKRAQEYIATKPANAPATSPENPGNLPWTFFSVTDYVRTLCLFHSNSPQFPGRLKPATEAAMKESLWLWVSGESRLADVGPQDLFLLLGTENHDLNRRPSYYLVTALLKDDPAYRDRKLADGHTTAEYAAAYTAFYREWPRRRAQTGLWVEVGSNTYQKYSWPALFNLHELAPDPVIRYRFGLLLDLAFSEETQISVQGRRDGGRSRAEYGPHPFDAYKNLLLATPGQPAGSSHSRVIETSRYQLPAEAILLSQRAFPAAKPFVIRNRILGELESPTSEDGHGQRLAADSGLVNYAYRTPTYLLGCTLQNPALALREPETGALTLKYAGISRQKRCCGLLFADPASAQISAVYPAVEHIGGGRSQHSFWSVQHENVLLLQRIARHGKSTLGSYNTGKLGMRFDGADLEKVEEDDWIFATNGKAFVGVKFLDGTYQCAVRWLRGHAAELGIDPGRIAAGGGSAGGHVAAATATLKGFNEAGEDTKTSCRPNALVLFNPVFDNGPDGYGHDRVKDYWKEFSPIDNIDPSIPPAVVFLGTKDKLIPVNTGRRFQTLMQQAGARCDLHLYEGEAHGFFNQQKYAETLIEADRFLVSLGYLQGEPTLTTEGK